MTRSDFPLWGSLKDKKGGKQHLIHLSYDGQCYFHCKGLHYNFSGKVYSFTFETKHIDKESDKPKCLKCSIEEKKMLQLKGYKRR